MNDDRLRRENTVWTVSEDYSFKPILELFDSYGDEEMDYYKMLVLGYVYKVMDMEAFLEFLYVHYNKTKLKEEFLKLCEIYFDDCLAGDLIRLRPGAGDYREAFLDKILARGLGTFDQDQSTGSGGQASKEMDGVPARAFYDTSQALAYVYYARIAGIFVDPVSLGISPLIVDLVDYMRARNSARTSEEIIKNLNGAFLKFFFVNTRMDLSQAHRFDGPDSSKDGSRAGDQRKDIETPKQSRLRLAMRKKFLKEGQDIDSDMTIESAEFTKGIDIDELVLDRNESPVSPSLARSNDTIAKMIADRFGKSVLPGHVVSSLESDLCRGIHKGIKLHFTRGDFNINRDNAYYAKSIKAQAESNLEYYRDNELVFRRSANELREILKKKLVFDDDEEMEYASSGSLVVSRIWRNKVFNEDKIFAKVDKREMTSISVDIVLDASASQMEREGQVAAQAYIIAEALTSLNIPTRVLSFSNFFNFLVVNEYRDYSDPASKNSKIFDYKASGSNRDGLALSLVAKMMDAGDYDKKVMIVLSDGKPNDKINLGTKGFFEVDGQDYVDDLAIRDTAQEVFNMKLRGKHVLGIFTGQEEDLDVEKKIFGRDFAYIKNYDRFSKLIGFYLDDILD